MKIKKIMISISVPILIILSMIFYLNQNIVVSETKFLMDTAIEIKLYGKNYDRKNLEKLITDSFEIIKEVDANSTSYVPLEGNAASLNRHSGTYYRVNTDVIEQLRTSIPFYEKTSGEFNVGIFRTVSLWRNAATANVLPTKEETTYTLGTSTPNDIKIDNLNNVYLPLDLEIDLGAVSKGYSLDKVAEFLRNSGVKSALINAGGNIYAVGKPADKKYFKIAIQNPNNINKIIGTSKLKDGQAISTSGSYNRYYEINGKKYSHILSGKTGYPVDLYKSVTVITNKGIISDILSTSLFLLSIEDGKKLIHSLEYPVEVLYVTLDDKIFATEGFPIDYSQVKDYIDK